MALKKRGGWSVGCLEILPAWSVFCRGQWWCWSSSPAGMCQWLELAVPGRTWSRRKAPGSSSVASSAVCHRGKSATLCDIPGTQSHSSCCSPYNPAVLAGRAASSLLSPLCFSLCRSCALHEHLEGAEAAVWPLACGRECSGGAVLTLCHLVNLIQGLTSAPNSSTGAV